MWNTLLGYFTCPIQKPALLSRWFSFFRWDIFHRSLEGPVSQTAQTARDDQLRPCDLVLEELVASTANTSPEDQVGGPSDGLNDSCGLLPRLGSLLDCTWLQDANQTSQSKTRQMQLQLCWVLWSPWRSRCYQMWWLQDFAQNGKKGYGWLFGWSFSKSHVCCDDDVIWHDTICRWYAAFEIFHHTKNPRTSWVCKGVFTPGFWWFLRLMRSPPVLEGTSTTINWFSWPHSYSAGH